MASLSHLIAEAQHAFNNVSFDPDGRGRRIIAEHETELTTDLASVAQWGGDTDRYQANYEKHFRAWLGATSRTASSFIVGSGNFPVRANQKKQETASRRYEDFRAWRSKALRAAYKSSLPKKTIDTEMASAARNLNNRMADQERMKAANQVIRSGKDVSEQLGRMGYSGRDIADLLRPDYMGKTGHKSWELSNNSANISRLSKRVAELQTKQERATAGVNQDRPFGGGVAVLNSEADRLQLHFEGKPAPDVIQKLKSRGFRWSPTNTAWQRQLTNSAIADAEYCVGPLLMPTPAAANGATAPARDQLAAYRRSATSMKAIGRAVLVNKTTTKPRRVAKSPASGLVTVSPTPQQRAAAAKSKLNLTAKALDLQLQLEMEMLNLLNL